MRELHVVALSDDGRHVVLATRPGTASGEFRVALDERMTAAVRGELPAPGRDAPPSISPRDIQARLRDGQSPEQIAAAAGVPLSRVERYAGPVLAELERMVTGALAAVVTRPRLGASALPLGAAVEAHLAEVAHLAEGSVRWSARRTEAGRWVVEVSWTARGRRRTAGWHYDPATREVAAVDGPSAVLGHVEAEAVPAAGRSAARPAAPAAAVRGAGGARSTSGSTRSASSAPAAAGRSVRSPAAPAATSAPAGGTARTSTPRTSSPRTAPAAAAPAAATGRRAAATPPPAAASARRRPAAAPAAEAGAAPATPAASTPTRKAPARAASADAAAGQGRAAAGRAQPRRPAPRRSAVPSLEELAAPTDGAAAPPAAPPSVPERPASPQAAEPDQTQVPAPPVLRVVPPAAPEPAQDHAPPPADPPARRVAGQRAGGRDWADVLMGAAPAPPAAPPRQD